MELNGKTAASAPVGLIWRCGGPGKTGHRFFCAVVRVSPDTAFCAVCRENPDTAFCAVCAGKADAAFSRGMPGRPDAALFLSAAE
jgi:hypothetical protein